MTVTVKIENDYSDGHHSESEVELETPSFTYLEDWWQDVVFEYTGDGHGNGDNGKLGSCYTATIIKTDDPVFLDESFEWID